MTSDNPGTGLLGGKAILVTGASSGIGAAAARVFAAEGASVMLAARSADLLHTAADELRAAGRNADFVVTDVSKGEDVARAVDATIARFGHLDGAFNNAAMGQGGKQDEVSEEDFDRILAVNVKGVWLCLREELRVMRAAGVGSIVNVSSIGGYRGSPGFGAYQATKHAVLGLTRTAAHDNGPQGIRVNALAPGPILTAMVLKNGGEVPEPVKARVAATPLRKAGVPEEVGHAAAWLLSDRASHVSGVTLPVDGGLTA